MGCYAARIAMSTKQTTTTERRAELTARPVFRVLAGIVSVMSFLSALGFLLGWLISDPLRLIGASVMGAISWLTGRLALRGAVRVHVSTTVEAVETEDAS